MNIFLIDIDITDTVLSNDRNIDLFKLADTLFEDMCEEDRTCKDLFTKRIILIIDVSHKFLLLLYIHQTVKIPTFFEICLLFLFINITI